MNDEGHVLLPAVGYMKPFELHPRHRERWSRLLAELAKAHVSVEDWPYRAEGTAGSAQRVAWLVLWGERGEAAVLDALEQRWAARHARETANQLADAIRPHLLALWAEGDHRPSQRQVADRMGYSVRYLEKRLGRHPGLWRRLLGETRTEALRTD